MESMGYKTLIMVNKRNQIIFIKNFQRKIFNFHFPAI